MSKRRKRVSASRKSGARDPSTPSQPNSGVEPRAADPRFADGTAESPLARWFRRPAWWVIGLAALVRVEYFVLYLLSPLHGYYIADHFYYREWALRIAAGEWLGTAVFEQAPLYPYLLGMIYAVFGERDALALALQSLAGVGTCLLVYRCGERLFGRPTAVVAGVACALYGPLVFYESMLMKSFLSPLLTMLALYALLRAAEGAAFRWTLLAGAAIGLACLERENHLLLLFPAVAWLLSSSFRRSGADRMNAVAASGEPGWQRRVALAAMLAAGWALAISPATIRNLAVGKEFVLVTAGGGEVFYMAHGPYATGFYRPPDFIRTAPGLEHEDFREEARLRTGRELTRAESSRYWFQEARREVFANPARAIRLTVVKALILLNDFEVPDSENYRASAQFVPLLRFLPGFGWIVGFGLLGIALACRDWRRRLLPLGFVAAHAASVLLTYNFGRFRLGMMPVWLLFAASAAVWVVATWQSGRRGVALVAGTAALGISAAAFLPPPGYADSSYDWDTQRLVGDLALRGGRPELAETGYRQALAAHHERFRRLSISLPESSEGIRRYRAIVFERAGERKGAQLMESAADVHARLGVAILVQDRPDDALEHFGLALEYHPGNVTALHRSGQLAAARGELDKAAGLFRRALDHAPRHEESHHGLALALSRQERFAEAFEHFAAAIEIEPNYVEARVNFAKTLAQAKRGAEAIEQLRAALRIRPEFAPALAELGRILTDSGQLDEGTELLLRAVEAEPPLPPDELAEAYEKLAIGQVRRGERVTGIESAALFSEATAHFREAIRLDPDRASLRFNFASLLARMGEREAARREAREALRLAPDYEPALRLLERL